MTGGFCFVRPVGAGADMKELLYVIALQQTSNETRQNATISSMDILALLKSRYDLTIRHEQAIAVVRSFGGGDTRPPGAEQVLAKMAEASKKKSKNRFHVKFRSHNSKGDEETDNNDMKDDDNDKFKELEPVESLEEKRTNISKKLSQLHQMHSTSQLGRSDSHSMLALKEQITASLREKVLKKPHSTNNTNPNNDSFATKSSTSGGKEDPTFTKKSLPDTSMLSNVPEFESSSQQYDEPRRKGEEVGGSLAEYLDLVHILTTLLTPKLARLAYNVEQYRANQAKAGGGAGGAAPDEEVLPNAETLLQQKEQENEKAKAATGLFSKLANRFVSYGRRKLQIKDEQLWTLSDVEILEIGRSALLKALPESEEPVLDETLVQLMLISHGEVERANDPVLIKEMLDAATGTTSSDCCYFDEQALVRAISSDLKPSWDPKCQDTNTPFFYDVFGVPYPSYFTKLVKSDQEHVEKRDCEQGGALTGPTSKEDDKPQSFLGKCCHWLFPVFWHFRMVKADFSTAFWGIDTVTDTSLSSVVHVLIWLWYICTATVYGALVLLIPNVGEECSSDQYACVLSNTIVSWMVIAVLLISMGFYLVVPLSVGDNPADQSPRRQFFACFMALVNTVIPFAMGKWAEHNLHKIDNADVRENVKDQSLDLFGLVTLVVGLFLAAMFGLQGLFMICVDRDHPHLLPQPLRGMVSGASWSREARIYGAAKFKIDKLVSNALRLHVEEESDTNDTLKRTKMTVSSKVTLSGTKDEVSRQYIIRGESEEVSGGMWWTFWKLFDGSLYDYEGIWINNRLVIIQVTQIVFTVLITFLLFYLSIITADEAGKQRADLEDDGLPEWIMDLFPTSAMILSAFIPATFVAMGALILIILVYIPSATATVLKYRGMVYPSLGAAEFQAFRNSVDSTYMNTANAIWGMIGTAVLFYIVVGFAIFLFAWPITRDIMMMIVAWGVGLGITIVVKMVVTGVCRKSQYRNFYRVKPVGARLSALALECWHIGLAGSVLIGRIGQILGAAILFVGRIDVPFLSPHVVLLGYGFDTLPSHFYKDLLVHEAHRHPYIEQLAQMYLMKLRYRDGFVSNAGAAWRQLLVLALFPWISKYRVFSDERRISAEHEAEEIEEKQQKEADHLAGVKDMKDGIVGGGKEATGEVVDVGKELYGAGEDIVYEVGRAGAVVLGERKKSNDQHPVKVEL